MQEGTWPLASLRQSFLDGAMVPLPHHEWAEVKPLAIGTVSLPIQEHCFRISRTRAKPPAAACTAKI
jgi:hypothetical protein